ncbi:aminoglycoside phosphotransferase family protein [Candidatus Chloroploca sp. Khr17]|uniref:aminoglycoside phosphotransferase family protein n=1 Tax=Candidatus Chloroploca sp. Khr17 TaxID=2496869 RepID=UPI00101C7720|nr:aminoglycoside phosphotransferase family protein [Candidatus Chloroploca sp. Khr17]
MISRTVDYSYLNHYVPPVTEGVSEPWRQALARLGDYTTLVVRTTNLRPRDVVFYGQTEAHLLVRISTLNEHLILRIAPEDDLSGYIFFMRCLNGQQLPGPQIIQRDLSRSLLPFAYTLESYVPGVSAADLTETHLLRGAGRQAGRALRRMQRVTTPGMGRPNKHGRWPTMRWQTTLARLGLSFAPPPTDSLVFSEAEQNAVARLLDDPRLTCEHPVLMHGNFGPGAVRCTSGPHVHLEALVEPGTCVGGDGLFDLATGLCASYPAAWREGLLDGYCATMPLSEAEQTRLPLLRLLASYWLASYRYSRALPHEAARDEARSLLETVAGMPIRQGA